MNKGTVWLMVNLLALSLTVAACAPAAVEKETAGTTTPTERAAVTKEVAKEMPKTEAVTPTASAEPRYGSTFIFPLTADVTAWDPYYGDSTPMKLYVETPGTANWMSQELTPEQFDFFKLVYVPQDLYKNFLAESVDFGDYKTVTMKLQKGIRFQDVPPVSGRELTAYDIAYSFNRMLGIGDGFTKPSTFVSIVNLSWVESVTAMDKYTVVFKAKEQTMFGTRWIMQDNPILAIVPREAIDRWGNMNEWKRVVGTGPFIMKEYVPGSFAGLVRNPNYWGTDERTDSLTLTR